MWSDNVEGHAVLLCVQVRIRKPITTAAFCGCRMSAAYKVVHGRTRQTPLFAYAPTQQLNIVLSSDGTLVLISVFSVERRCLFMNLSSFQRLCLKHELAYRKFFLEKLRQDRSG